MFMGNPTINNFDINIISRTIENLDVNVPNTFTHLLNSLLGLIVLPRQWNIQGRRDIEHFNKPLNEYNELNYFNDITYYDDDNQNNVQTKVLELKPDERTTITLKSVIDKLRHSIAHQSIRPTKEGDSWKGVIFRTYRNDTDTSLWNDNYNLQLYLTQDQLERFVKFVATTYLEETKIE